MDLKEIAAAHRLQVEKHEAIGELVAKLAEIKSTDRPVTPGMGETESTLLWLDLINAIKAVTPTYKVWMAAFQLAGLCSDSIKEELLGTYGVDIDAQGEEGQPQAAMTPLGVALTACRADAEPPRNMQGIDSICTKAVIKPSRNFQLRYPQILLQSTFYTELGLTIDSNVVQFNNVQDLPPVGCNILIKLPAGTPIMGALILDAPLILTAERTSHVDARGKDMHYALKDGTIIRGQFEWTYP